jgi:hypothetical protein
LHGTLAHEHGMPVELRAQAVSAPHGSSATNACVKASSAAASSSGPAMVGAIISSGTSNKMLTAAVTTDAAVAAMAPVRTRRFSQAVKRTKWRRRPLNSCVLFHKKKSCVLDGFTCRWSELPPCKFVQEKSSHR